MTNTPELYQRNQRFAASFAAGDLAILPKLRTVIVTCADARVDPAHLFDLALGEAVVLRNNGGRVTDDIIGEIATLAFMVAMMEGGAPGPFEVVLLQHTQCGAERFADPAFQQAIMGKLGIDLSDRGITDHDQSLKDDVARLRATPQIPDHVVVSAMLYDVKTGAVSEVVAPAQVR